MRLQRLSLDRKGLVTQAKDCDPSNNLLDPLFVLAGERGRARAIAIAPPVDGDDPRGTLRAKRERASNDGDPRGALRAKREPQPPSPQAPSTLQRARPGEVRKEGRGDGLKSNSSLCDKALLVQREGL